VEAFRWTTDDATTAELATGDSATGDVATGDAETLTTIVMWEGEKGAVAVPNLFHKDDNVCCYSSCPKNGCDAVPMVCHNHTYMEKPNGDGVIETSYVSVIAKIFVATETPFVETVNVVATLPIGDVATVLCGDMATCFHGDAATYPFAQATALSSDQSIPSNKRRHVTSAGDSRQATADSKRRQATSGDIAGDSKRRQATSRHATP